MIHIWLLATHACDNGLIGLHRGCCWRWAYMLWWKLIASSRLNSCLLHMYACCCELPLNMYAFVDFELMILTFVNSCCICTHVFVNLRWICMHVWTLNSWSVCYGCQLVIYCFLWSSLDIGYILLVIYCYICIYVAASWSKEIKSHMWGCKPCVPGTCTRLTGHICHWRGCKPCVPGVGTRLTGHICHWRGCKPCVLGLAPGL